MTAATIIWFIYAGLVATWGVIFWTGIADALRSVTPPGP